MKKYFTKTGTGLALAHPFHSADGAGTSFI